MSDLSPAQRLDRMGLALWLALGVAGSALAVALAAEHRVRALEARVDAVADCCDGGEGP